MQIERGYKGEEILFILACQPVSPYSFQTKLGIGPKIEKKPLDIFFMNCDHIPAKEGASRAD